MFLLGIPPIKTDRSYKDDIDVCSRRNIRIKDDAGRECYQDEIKEVILHNVGVIGHTFIELPGHVMKGFYPGNSDFWKGAGQVLDEEKYKDKKKSVFTSLSYKACPESVRILSLIIQIDEKNRNTEYNFFNISDINYLFLFNDAPLYTPRYNCTATAYNWLEAAGFKSPDYYVKNYPFFSYSPLLYLKIPFISDILITEINFFKFLLQ